MADENSITLLDDTSKLPVIAASPGEVARIENGIDIRDRAAISVFGDRAQQAVSDYADKILSQIRNRDLGDTGTLLTDIIMKAKNLDPASLKEEGFLSNLFSSFKARLERFQGEVRGCRRADRPHRPGARSPQGHPAPRHRRARRSA